MGEFWKNMKCSCLRANKDLVLIFTSRNPMSKICLKSIERERDEHVFLIVFQFNLPSFLRRYFQYFILIWGIIDFTHKSILRSERYQQVIGLTERVRALLDECSFGLYSSVLITEFSKRVRSTKLFLFSLVFNPCFNHSKLKNLNKSDKNKKQPTLAYF